MEFEFASSLRHGHAPFLSRPDGSNWRPLNIATLRKCRRYLAISSVIKKLQHIPKLGNPTNARQAAAVGRGAQTRTADRFAQTVMPVIASLQKSGITSLRGIANALNGRGVRTTRGCDWQVSSVRNVLARASIIS
jgi:hypothetical protein